jgi:hypothetical protein
MFLISQLEFTFVVKAVSKKRWHSGTKVINKLNIRLTSRRSPDLFDPYGKQPDHGQVLFQQVGSSATIALRSLRASHCSTKCPPHQQTTYPHPSSETWRTTQPDTRIYYQSMHAITHKNKPPRSSPIGKYFLPCRALRQPTEKTSPWALVSPT